MLEGYGGVGVVVDRGKVCTVGFATAHDEVEEIAPAVGGDVDYRLVGDTILVAGVAQELAVTDEHYPSCAGDFDAAGGGAG